MASPSKTEAQLLSLSNFWDDAIAQKSIARIEWLLADDVTMSKDNVSLFADLQGKTEVRSWVKAQFDRYEYSHRVIATAVNAQDNTAFSCWHEQDLRPIGHNYPGDWLPPHARKACNITGLRLLQLNQAGKVQRLWILRQLSADELHLKLCSEEIPLRLSIGRLHLRLRRALVVAPIGENHFDPRTAFARYSGSGMKVQEAGLKQMLAAAAAVGGACAAPSVAAVEKLFHPKVHQWDPVSGRQLDGWQEVQACLHYHSKEKQIESWEVRAAATTDSNKAFVHWSTMGLHHRRKTQECAFGLAMLVFNEEMQVYDMICARHPTIAEAKRILKEEYVELLRSC